MKRLILCAAVATLLPGVVQAVTIETVKVGNPGNDPDDEVMSDRTTGYGSVDYIYRIGKYEITNAQYCEFLNAVAADDTYGLYNTRMWSRDSGCKIERSGLSGSYSYTVATNRENRPVNYISWGDAARFANWLHNGQPVGAQDLTTTEDGAYFLNGATTDLELMAVTRESDATWFLPTENQWYKAAFYDGAHSVYYDYPTGTNAVPDNGNPSGDTGNTANFYDGDRFFSNGDVTVGSPYWTTPVGQFTLSESPYGTFDQCGNVWEWNETAVNSSVRGLRGGAWGYESRHLHASYRDIYFTPTFEFYGVGFRVAKVPEPGSPTLLVCGLVASLIWWRSRAG